MLKLSDIRVIDGDTIHASIRLPFDIVLDRQVIRLAGIDTPESRTSDPVEKVFGMAAKKRLSELVSCDVYICASDSSKDKYGRILGVIRIENGLSINDTLVLERFAVAYDGKSKNDIRDAHKNNRRYLVENGIVKPHCSKMQCSD